MARSGEDPGRRPEHAIIDHKNKVVHSVTGQLTWDYGDGVCTIDGSRRPGSHGISQKVSPITLNDVTIQSSNDYATVMLAALDGKPLKESQSVLVQVGTIARPTGWTERAATFRR